MPPPPCAYACANGSEGYVRYHVGMFIQMSTDRAFFLQLPCKPYEASGSARSAPAAWRSRLPLSCLQPLEDDELGVCPRMNLVRARTQYGSWLTLGIGMLTWSDGGRMYVGPARGSIAFWICSICHPSQTSVPGSQVDSSQTSVARGSTTAQLTFAAQLGGRALITGEV